MSLLRYETGKSLRRKRNPTQRIVTSNVRQKTITQCFSPKSSSKTYIPLVKLEKALLEEKESQVVEPEQEVEKTKISLKNVTDWKDLISQAADIDKTLNQHRPEAFKTVLQTLRNTKPIKPILLNGVSGSGKTMCCELLKKTKDIEVIDWGDQIQIHEDTISNWNESKATAKGYYQEALCLRLMSDLFRPLPTDCSARAIIIDDIDIAPTFIQTFVFNTRGNTCVLKNLIQGKSKAHLILTCNNIYDGAMRRYNKSCMVVKLAPISNAIVDSIITKVNALCDVSLSSALLMAFLQRYNRDVRHALTNFRLWALSSPTQSIIATEAVDTRYIKMGLSIMDNFRRCVCYGYDEVYDILVREPMLEILLTNNWSNLFQWFNNSAYMLVQKDIPVSFFATCDYFVRIGYVEANPAMVTMGDDLKRWLYVALLKTLWNMYKKQPLPNAMQIDFPSNAQLKADHNVGTTKSNFSRLLKLGHTDMIATALTMAQEETIFKHNGNPNKLNLPTVQSLLPLVHQQQLLAPYSTLSDMVLLQKSAAKSASSALLIKGLESRSKISLSNDFVTLVKRTEKVSTMCKPVQKKK